MERVNQVCQWLAGVALTCFIIGVFTLTGVLISVGYLVGVLTLSCWGIYYAVHEVLSSLSPERSDGERGGEG